MLSTFLSPEAARRLRHGIPWVAREEIRRIEGGMPSAPELVELRGEDGIVSREVEVLGFLARGLSMKETAQRLVVSPKTIDHHVQHIYTKIDVRTRPAARLFALEHGLAYDGPLV